MTTDVLRPAEPAGRNRVRDAVPPVPEQAAAGIGRDVETVRAAVRR